MTADSKTVWKMKIITYEEMRLWRFVNIVLPKFEEALRAL